MVAITSGTVLITGGSGFIGAWIVKSAVDRGYSVVAAVRTEAQGKFLVNRFPEYHGKVAYVIVPDIEKDGAYDDVVKNMDAIIHAASPVIFKGNDPEGKENPLNASARLVITSLPHFHPKAVLRPASRGALGILESAHKHGKNVKRVVLTSSGAAIGDAIVRDGKPVRDETVWNTRATAEVETRGKDAHPPLVYAASKTYAEQRSWAWVKEHKPSWDLVTILPPYVLGPYIHQPRKPAFGSTPGLLLDFVLKHPDTSGGQFGNFVEVRDTANIHILALEHPDVAVFFLSNAGEFSWQDIYDIFNSAGFPNVNAPGKITRGGGRNKVPTITSNEKAAKLWPNFRYHTFESSIRELGEQLVKEGYLRETRLGIEVQFLPGSYLLSHR
ncbi:hypothetical protein BS47DRAFT_1483305 [Hydnum rufescens UP504]|uniref:NAD-dependent epimerase/dehydratase domain-containing protein n=1 Tax=Hydnum rufescens UP504 TaxID=1448309 RepID=A0A9P6B6T4_9AGAM|nr:hypothetical protein BS47DRAFT_1483305 [Hydnum rufescens UP504]